MENLINPIHQFEVRFDPMIDFNHTVRGVLAPYIQRTTSFKIENEGTTQERIFLAFDLVTVGVWWDKIVLTSQNGLTGLNLSNSIVEEPFFSILEKLKQLPSFGRIKSVFFYVLAVKVEDGDYDTIFEKIKKRFLSAEAFTFYPEFNDLAINFNRVTETENIAINVGPYRDLNDFLNRNFRPSEKFINSLEEKNGYFIEYTSILILPTSLNFKIYKTMMTNFHQQVDKI